jgi:hypothetical protein
MPACGITLTCELVCAGTLLQAGVRTLCQPAAALPWALVIRASKPVADNYPASVDSLHAGRFCLRPRGTLRVAS